MLPGPIPMGRSERTTPPRPTSSRSSSRRRSERLHFLSSLEPITTRPTARPCAITCTSATSPALTSKRSIIFSQKERAPAYCPCEGAEQEMQQYRQQERPSPKGRQVGKFFRRLLAIVFIGTVAAVVIYASVLPSAQKQAGGRRAKMGNDPVPVAAAQARIGDVPLYLEGVGTAKAYNTVTVRAQVDGRILGINFKEGQEVKRGDVLVRIDPATYQAQLEQATAKKAHDEAHLANAQRDMERYSKLGGNIVAQKTIDTQRALVDQLTAQLKLDDAAIANAKAFLDYTTIIAPINGRTGIRMVDVGNLVRASDAGIVVITELRPISVLFALPQQQLVQINRALVTAPLSVDALDADGKSVLDRGTVQVVDNQVDQTTGTIRLKAEFPNASLQLWPGQFVNVRVLVDTLK